MALSFDTATGRYRDAATGRYVSDASVRSVVDSIADGASARMAAASERMLAGDMLLAEFQSTMMREVKLSQLAASTIAHGGQAQMGFSQYGAAGNAIRVQYDYIRQFAAQVADGTQPLNGSLIARAKQYGQASRVTYSKEYGRDQMQRGYAFERNILGAAEHCSLCPDLTTRGWVPIGSLPSVGSRPCRSNDRCHIVYRKEQPASVAA
jgi:hypothetical protein